MHLGNKGCRIFTFPFCNFDLTEEKRKEKKKRKFTTAINELMFAFVDRRQLISRLSIPIHPILQLQSAMPFIGNYNLRPPEHTAPITAAKGFCWVIYSSEVMWVLCEEIIKLCSSTHSSMSRNKLASAMTHRDTKGKSSCHSCLFACNIIQKKVLSCGFL